MSRLILNNFRVYIDGLEIIKQATLDIAPGVVCGIVGPNGAGKTTLIRGLMGALNVAGKANFGDLDLTRSPMHKRVFLGIGYMPGDRQLVPELTVAQNISLPAWNTKRPDAARRLDDIYRLIPEVARLADRHPTELSGGQQKLVALGRSMMAGQRMLVLDEPFEGVAPVLVQRIAEILFSLKSEGMSILVSDSYESHLDGWVDQICPIERGVAVMNETSSLAAHR